jgi:RHS repeat-associated protein
MTDPQTLTRNSTTYYYHNDHLGTPQSLTDQNGQIVWQAERDAFGNSQENTQSITNNLGFAGQYLDRESGLYYNWHRYYDAGVGRYIETDPIGLAGGINTYAYVKGNPVRFVDQRGLAVVTTTASIGLSAMFGPIGGSVSVGSVVGTDGQKCVTVQVCFRFGFGFLASAGASLGVGANAGSTSDSGGISLGVGGDFAVGGAGAGGQATVGLDSPSAGAAKGSLGYGLGFSAGADLCFAATTSCMPLCQF